MILGVEELLRRVREENLVEDLSERELQNPEGAGFDLRIGELFALRGRGFLGIKERETPEMEKIAAYDADRSTVGELAPGTYYVMKTIEKVNTPLDLAILFRPRSTLYRSGVTAFTGNCAPGYAGELNFGIMNFGRETFRLEMGSRIVHAMFYEVKGGGSQYRGQWQGGRTTTDQREQQV